MYSEIQIVKADDWCALYLDGVVQEQGHTVREDWLADMFARALARGRVVTAICIFNLEETDEVDAWFERTIEFPTNFADIPSRFLGAPYCGRP